MSPAPASAGPCEIRSLKACPHCRRKVRLSLLSRRYLLQSHFCATVSLFCDSVDSALRGPLCNIRSCSTQAYTNQTNHTQSLVAYMLCSYTRCFLLRTDNNLTSHLEWKTDSIKYRSNLELGRYIGITDPALV